MREGEAVSARAPSASRRGGRLSQVDKVPFIERRRAPRPRLAEIRRGAKLNLLPPSVVTGSVRIIEFLLVAALGFAIYLALCRARGNEQPYHLFDRGSDRRDRQHARLPGLQPLRGAGLQRLRAELHPHRLRLEHGGGRHDGARLLRQGRRRLLARVDRHLVCGGAVDAVRRAARAFAHGQALDQGRAPQSPRGDRRRRARGRGADQSARGLDRHRYPHRRHFRRPRRRPRLARSSPATPSSAISTSSSPSRATRGSTCSSCRCRSPPRSGCSQLLKKLWVLPVDIRLSAHNNQLRFRPRTYSYIGNVPFIDITDKPIADWDHVKKWLFDKIVGSLAADPARAGDGGDRARSSSSTPRVRCCSGRSARASTTS